MNKVINNLLLVFNKLFKQIISILIMNVEDKLWQEISEKYESYDGKYDSENRRKKHQEYCEAVDKSKLISGCNSRNIRIPLR